MSWPLPALNTFLCVLYCVTGRMMYCKDWSHAGTYQMYHRTTRLGLTHLDLVTEWFPTRTLITLALSNCWRVPITMNSVLSLLNIRLFCWVYFLMSAMQASMASHSGILTQRVTRAEMKGITENRLQRSELQVGEPQRFQLNFYSRCWITVAQGRTLAERHRGREGMTSIAYD